MNINFRLNLFFKLGLTFLLILLIFPIKAALQVKHSEFQLFSLSTPYERRGYSKLESTLYQLMEIYFLYGQERAKEFAEIQGVDMAGDLVRVVAEADSWREAEEVAGIDLLWSYWRQKISYPKTQFQRSASEVVSTQIVAFGGKVETVYRDLVQSMVPVYFLQDLARLPSIKYLRLPKKPIPFAVSEGVEIIGADLWQAVDPYRASENVKVCILDLGFGGYDALLGTELPETVTVRSFRSDGDLSLSDHGTACAEIVYDMYPDAELFLVNFGTDVEHHNALSWIISQNVDIISCSLGWFNIGAGDGTGPICEDVEIAHDSGVVWVSSVGNNAEMHWQGTFRDPDLNDFCNFEQPGQPSDEWFQLNVVAGNLYSIYLNWDDWGNWNGSYYTGSQGNDYDLYLYDSGGLVLASSNNDQTGGAPPEESIEYLASSTGVSFIRVFRYETTRDCELELFFHGVDSIEWTYQIPAGSLAIPADSPYAVAVGATYWLDDSYEFYSSQGPTHDGRVKPDFCAPVGITTSTYGSLGFFGTSAATPHVAGALALFKGKTPYSLEDIQAILEARAVDLGQSGKDNLFGYGRINLSAGTQNTDVLRRVLVEDKKTITSSSKRKPAQRKDLLKEKDSKRKIRAF